jgi:hypothetical protein
MMEEDNVNVGTIKACLENRNLEGAEQNIARDNLKEELKIM